MLNTAAVLQNLNTITHHIAYKDWILRLHNFPQGSYAHLIQFTYL